MPWDMRAVPPALVQYLRRRPEPGEALIPGCGSGYEVRAFHDAAWKAIAIDFAPAAVNRARAVLRELADNVRRADFFTDSLGGPYDVIYERTFLCSLPPDRWPAYASRAAALLRPHGCLAGLFVYGQEPEPPPFLLTWPDAFRVLAERFALVEDCAIAPEQSLPLFAGRERWQVWKRK